MAQAAISAERCARVHQYPTLLGEYPGAAGDRRHVAAAAEHYRELPAFYRGTSRSVIEALRPSRLEICPVKDLFPLADYSAISDLDDVSFCRWLTTEIGVAAIPLSVFCADPFRTS